MLICIMWRHWQDSNNCVRTQNYIEMPNLLKTTTVTPTQMKYRYSYKTWNKIPLRHPQAICFSYLENIVYERFCCIGDEQINLLVYVVGRAKCLIFLYLKKNAFVSSRCLSIEPRTKCRRASASTFSVWNTFNILINSGPLTAVHHYACQNAW